MAVSFLDIIDIMDQQQYKLNVRLKIKLLFLVGVVLSYKCGVADSKQLHLHSTHVPKNYKYIGTETSDWSIFF